MRQSRQYPTRLARLKGDRPDRFWTPGWPQKPTTENTENTEKDLSCLRVLRVLTNRDGVVNGFIRPAGFMEGLDVLGSDPHVIKRHLADELWKNLLRLRQPRDLNIL